MQGQGILSYNSSTVDQAGINEYANELIKEMRFNGDSFSKCEKQIEKRLGAVFTHTCNDILTVDLRWINERISPVINI